MARTAASIKTLIGLKDVDHALAERIRFIWKDAKKSVVVKIIEADLHHGFLESLDLGRMLAINKIAGYSGVEFLGFNKRGEDVDYLNAGDAYTPTMIFIGERMIVSCWGDLIEKKYIKEERNF